MSTAGELRINDTLCGNMFFWSLCLWSCQHDMSDKGSCITIQYLPIQIAPKYFFKHGLHWGLISIHLFLWSSVLKHQPSCATCFVYTWKYFFLAWSRTILLNDCFRNSPAQWGRSCSISLPPLLTISQKYFLKALLNFSEFESLYTRPSQHAL